MAEAEKKTVILDFQVDEGDAVVSIEKLTKANKELREERKKVDLSTEEGIKKVRDINAQIEKNTQTITANSTTIEKNRANVGNYTESINKSRVGQADFNKTLGAATPALDQMSGGLVSATSGFMSMVRASLAFIATPIGAVIAALGAGIAALTAYFKSSEDAENRLTKITTVFGAVVEQLMNGVEFLGEKIFNAFANPQQALKDLGSFLQDQLVNRFMGLLELIPKLGEAVKLLFEGKFEEAGTVAGNAVIKVTAGVENGIEKLIDFTKEVAAAVEEGVKNGERLAAIQRRLDREERDLIVARAKTALEVGKLREEALTQEGEVKRATIQEAIDLETQLAELELAHAQAKQEQAQIELENNGDTIEAKKKVAEAIAEVLNAEANRYAATLRFNKEIAALDEAEAAHKKKLLDDEEAAKIKADEARKKRSEQAAKETAAWFDAKFKAEMEQIEKEEAIRIDAAEREKKRREDILKAIEESLSVAASLVSQFTDYQQNQYRLEENALEVSLANKNKLLSDEYNAEKKLFDDQLKNGQISQEEYDKKLLALDKKLKEDEKKAEIEQKKKLDDVKRKAFEANKKTQIAETTIQIAQAALAAFRALAGVPLVGPILGAAAAAAAVTFGALKIKQIRAEQFVPATFRTGGYTGDGDPNQLAGQVHKSEFVMPADVVARYGKEHFQSYMDGSVVANASTGGMKPEQQQQKIVVYASWTEFKKFETEMKMKETVTTK
jgi:hypothetical protein